MTTLVLTCRSPDADAARPARVADPPGPLGAAVVRAVPARPGREELDPLLTQQRPDRVVVAGTDADLAAVVLRLLRTDRLAGTEVGYLPAEPDSAVARVWGLPTDAASATELALRGEPDPVPLVRDDNGGVLLGRGEVRPVRGVVYCDDELVLRGQAGRLVVTPLAPVGVDVRALGIGLLRRVRAASGRAVQVGCLSAEVTRDGVAHPGPVTRWTWYKHTEPLRLVRGLTPAA